MKPKYICILLLLSIIFGCNQQNTKGIHIDIDEMNEVSMFDLFSKIEIIKLETTEKSLVREVLKIIVEDKKIFIHDFPKSEIIVFDFDGKYISKIDNRGQGPDQYPNISDFEIDSTNKRLTLLSSVDRNMHEYDLNCNFIRKFKLPNITGAYQSFKFLNSKTIVFWTFDYNNRIKFYSIKDKIIFKETYPEKENLFNIFTRYEFPYQNYLTRSSRNLIQKVNDDCSIENAYEWDFGDLNIDAEKLQKIQESVSSKNIREFAKNVHASSNTNYIFNIQGGNSRYLYTQITRKNKFINIIYDTSKNKKFVFEKSTEGAMFNPIFWTNDYVIGIHLDPNKSYDETIPNTILDDKNILTKKKINEFDNPILIKYYFKK